MIFLCVSLNLWAFSSGCGVQWFEIAKCAPLKTGWYADRLLSRRSPFCTSVCLSVFINRKSNLWDGLRGHNLPGIVVASTSCESYIDFVRGSRSIMWILLSSQHYVSAHKLRIITKHNKYDNRYQVVNSFVWRCHAEGVFIGQRVCYILLPRINETRALSERNCSG